MKYKDTWIPKKRKLVRIEYIEPLVPCPYLEVICLVEEGRDVRWPCLSPAVLCYDMGSQTVIWIYWEGVYLMPPYYQSWRKHGMEPVMRIYPIAPVACTRLLCST